MGYFRELPDLAYQSPLLHKNSSRDYVLVKNLFRRTKLFDFLKDNVSLLDKFTIGDGDRPDMIAEELYNDPSLDYVVILVAGITNIYEQWPLQDFQVFDYALQKYGSESALGEVKHYKTLEIVDDQQRLILPPDLIVDADFKIDGTNVQYPSNKKYTLKALTGNRQLDDKDTYSVKTDNIAKAVTNFEYEVDENEKNREIDVLQRGYLTTFVNDMRDILRYDRHSRYISGNLSSTELTDLTS